MDLVFKNPMALWFLLSIVLLIIVHILSFKHVKKKALKFANFEAIERVTGIQLLSQNISLLSIRIFTLVLIVFTLAGTTLYYTGQSSDFDFILAIDSSSSMTSDDFQPSRLESAKTQAIRFIDTLASQAKIGVVSFSGTSFIEQELTDNLGDAKRAIENIQEQNIGGTDLGEAIVSSSNSLLTSQRGRVVILLTDGQTNAGIPIKEAIAYAFSKNILIYAIGMATEAGGLIQGTKSISQLDENTLQTIATNTGGIFYKVADTSSLEKAYKEISSSTKESVSLDLTFFLITLTFLMLFLEWGLINIKYRTIP